MHNTSTSAGNCMARALYDNIAESPDELPFRKGEILTVLEQNTGGLEGWWLCSLRGRQGICPANRLRLIPGFYDTGSGLTSISKLQGAPTKVVTPKRTGDVFTYDTPRPTSLSDSYDYPPNRPKVAATQPPTDGGRRLGRSSSMRCESPKVVLRSSLEQYDSPRSQEAQYDCPSSRPIYDTPRPSHQNSSSSQQPDQQKNKSLIKGIRQSVLVTKAQPPANEVVRRTPTSEDADRNSKISLMSIDSQLSTSSSASSLPASESLSLSSFGEGSSNRSSIESHDLYDIPPEPRRVQNRPQLPPREKRDVTDNRDIVARLQSQSMDGVYDVPPQVSRQNPSDSLDSLVHRISSSSDSSGLDIDTTGLKELALELSSARDMLTKLENEVYSSAQKFMDARNQNAHQEVLKAAMIRIQLTLHELLDFSRGSVGNGLRLPNPNVCKKLVSLIEPLESIEKLVTDSCSELGSSPHEQVAQVASVMTSLKENVRHLCSTIQAHSDILFKKSPTIPAPKDDNDKTPLQERPLPQIPQTLQDYANLSHNQNISCSVSYGTSTKDPGGTEKPLDNASHPVVLKLDASDRQVLNFYGTQAKLHLQNLNVAIDAFLLTIENNQPPKVFIAHSKFVILGAHKIVYIGDTVHRNLVNNELRASVLACSNALCDAMKTTVATTKTAALQFPSVTAVQAMVDAFVSISQLASNLKTAICRE